MYGWKGKILRVDLATRKINKEDLPIEWANNYIGCRGINDIILYKEVGPEVDPFSQKNKLIFGTGPLDGTPIGMSRVSVQTKHTKKCIGEGGAGGFWGPQLKYAGYDFIVFENKSDIPVYIYINDDKVEIEDAKDLWGRNTREKNSILRRKLGTDIQIASIGSAGEKLVHDAKIEFTMDHSGGRGCGTIMGDKKLAAVAVRGTGGVKIKDPTKFMAGYRKIRKILDLKETVDAFVPSWAFLSANMMGVVFNEEGRLQAYNAQKGRIEGFLNARDYLARHVIRPDACFCCPFPACGRKFEIKGGKYSGEIGQEREGGFSGGQHWLGSNHGLWF